MDNYSNFDLLSMHNLFLSFLLILLITLFFSSLLYVFMLISCVFSFRNHQGRDALELNPSFVFNKIGRTFTILYSLFSNIHNSYLEIHKSI